MPNRSGSRGNARIRTQHYSDTRHPARMSMNGRRRSGPSPIRLRQLEILKFANQEHGLQTFSLFEADQFLELGHTRSGLRQIG